ncbi:MAG: DUF5681 domain-containing protein [Steroidobacteraceae bacterium]
MARKKPKKSRSKSNSYSVGYGRPPQRFQFKPGQSGNPTGTKRKASSIAPDLKALLERALNKKVRLRQGEQDRILSRGAAGIEQLVDQFAAGDRNARRDLMLISEKLGVDLTKREALEGAFDDVQSAQDEAILADFVERHGGHYPRWDDSVGPLPRQESNGQTLPSIGSNPPALPRERLDDDV